MLDRQQALFYFAGSAGCDLFVHLNFCLGISVHVEVSLLVSGLLPLIFDTLRCIRIVL